MNTQDLISLFALGYAVGWLSRSDAPWWVLVVTLPILVATMTMMSFILPSS